MIERIVFRNDLPQIYEVTLLHGDGTPIDTPIILRAELLDSALDGTQFSREDVIFNALQELDVAEDAPDLTYSMRLMHPKETRKHWRSTLRSVIRAACAKSVTESPAYKQLTERDILSTVIIMNELEPAAT